MMRFHHQNLHQHDTSIVVVVHHYTVLFLDFVRPFDLVSCEHYYESILSRLRWKMNVDVHH